MANLLPEHDSNFSLPTIFYANILARTRQKEVKQAGERPVFREKESQWG